MLARRAAGAYLKEALGRGASLNPYEVRTYQVTAAFKAATQLCNGHNAVLTLPTGTGKTVICGMTAALFKQARPDARVVITAPRRTLLSQLHARSRWLNPTASTAIVGADPRQDDRFVRAAFHHVPIVFGMPEFLTRRLQRRVVPQDQVASIGLVIVDEFDAFLTLRYLAKGVVAGFHEAFAELRAAIPDDCRLLLVSATTPEASSPDPGASLDRRQEVSAQVAFRSFLDEALNPEYVTISPRYYEAYIPHAELAFVAVDDLEVRDLDQAIDDDVSLTINWISGAIGAWIDPTYVLPRLPIILSGRMGLFPGGPKLAGDGPLKGLLGRLLFLSHLPDFIYEDMAEGVTWRIEETTRFTSELDARMRTTEKRIQASIPDKPDAPIRRPKLGAKFAALEKILARHADERGVIFFRYVRVLEAAALALRGQGWNLLVVHGERSLQDNDAALATFRATPGMLLLITRDTGKRGLDLPEGDFAVFYSPKAREDVTWQEVSRIRSTIGSPKQTYIMFYAQTGEAEKTANMLEALERTTHSKAIKIITVSDLTTVD
ncbi:DEAD/DEAH box helicase [Caulobacter segnis]|uniref:DEAD/DEAH box helicase n=1 Tax=Caulobacter segnis TaxID=88688 RepID=UPI001CC08E1B|nr:DEAD/DEAH box helicase [Caulobacter segnis]UAL10153.1 DEAD/DEAH box helicase [Caulobacter segnis]